MNKITTTATNATTSTATTSPERIPATSTQVATSPGAMVFNVAIFLASSAASLALAYYLITDPSRLTEVWTWVRGLPLIVQLAMWALLLPWMAALWIWSTPWALGLRVVLVVGVLLFAEYLVFPWKA